MRLTPRLFCARLDGSSSCRSRAAIADQRPAFTFDYTQWHEIVCWTRGGVAEKPPTYVAAFCGEPAGTVKIRGLRRSCGPGVPDYVENSENFKHTYLKPVTTGSGDIQPFLDFMAHLLPVPFLEREWFSFSSESTGWRNGSSRRSPASQSGDVGAGRQGPVLARPPRLCATSAAACSASLPPACRFDISRKVGAGHLHRLPRRRGAAEWSTRPRTADASRGRNARAAYERFLLGIAHRSARDRALVLWSRAIQRFFGAVLFAAFLIYQQISSHPNSGRGTAFRPPRQWEQDDGTSAKAVAGLMISRQHRELARWMAARDNQQVRAVRAPEDTAKTAIAGAGGSDGTSLPHGGAAADWQVAGLFTAISSRGDEARSGPRRVSGRRLQGLMSNV